jgi:hypothetical protein
MRARGRRRLTRRVQSGSRRCVRRDCDRAAKDAVACPGPGQYSESPVLSSRGDYFNSKYKSSLCRRFSKGSRDFNLSGLLRVSTPGPGSYQLSSDFFTVKNDRQTKTFDARTFMMLNDSRKSTPSTRHSRTRSQGLLTSDSTPRCARPSTKVRALIVEKFSRRTMDSCKN